LDANTRTEVDALLLPQHALRELLQRMPQLWRHIAELAFDDMELALAGCADLLLPRRRRRQAGLLWGRWLPVPWLPSGSCD
jgi:hypothetical protein